MNRGGLSKLCFELRDDERFGGGAINCGWFGVDIWGVVRSCYR